MHLAAMDVHARDEAHVLAFGINMLTPSAHDQVKFVSLLETRFAGEQGGIGRFWRMPGKPFGSVEIRFPDAESYRNAKAFCREKLTRSGMMIASDRAALDDAGDAASKADRLFRRMQAKPIQDRPLGLC